MYRGDLPRDDICANGKVCFLDICDKAQQDDILKPVFRNKHKKLRCI